MRRELYILTIEFSTTINAGAQGQAYAQVDTSGAFVAQSMAATVFLPVAQTSVARTPACEQPSPTIGSNTFMPLAGFRLQIALAGVNWFSNPVNLATIGGRGGAPFYFQTQPVLTPGAQLVATLFNDVATFNVQAQIAIIGYKQV